MMCLRSMSRPSGPPHARLQHRCPTGPGDGTAVARGDRQRRATERRGGIARRMRRDLNETILQLCVLDDPARRAAYLAVRPAGRPLTCAEVADEVGISVRLAAFHLEKLLSEGFLEANYERDERSVGVGHPAKRYRPTGIELEVSIPLDGTNSPPRSWPRPWKQVPLDHRWSRSPMLPPSTAVSSEGVRGRATAAAGWRLHSTSSAMKRPPRATTWSFATAPSVKSPKHDPRSSAR